MTTPSCQSSHRRQDVRDAALYGFDYVEVSADQRTLEVFFLGRAPSGIEEANIRITGGRKILNIAVTGMTLYRQKDFSLDDYMEVDVDRSGDFSVYTLSLVTLDDQGRPTETPLPGFDPLYGSVDFSFKVACPNDQDCLTPSVCPPPLRVEPEINYLAKDYGSFRQLLLDRLALTLPAWSEGHVPDIGIMLVELLAYAGDQLSYYQDAVATEAYLGTARHRISVRRHTKLVDYTLHEGCNARAFVTLATDTDATLDPAQLFFCTGYPGSPAGGILQPADLEKAPPGSYRCFSLLQADAAKPLQIYAEHSAISFYSWGEGECCLPLGTTAATLTDRWIAPPAAEAEPAAVADAPKSVLKKMVKQSAAPAQPLEPPGARRALNLAVGDILIFEEVIGPKTGDPADADPAHRQAVRLTKVSRDIDPLYHPYSPDFGQPIVEIEWCSEDALRFPLCLSSTMPAPHCSLLSGISVARGNVVLVDHGLAWDEALGSVGVLSTATACPSDCAPAETQIIAAPFRPKLSEQPLTFAVLLPCCGCAGALLEQDPRQALPRVTLTSTIATLQGPQTSRWSAVGDLLHSGPQDCHFVVEMDDDAIAHLRFGNGREGMQPQPGASFAAHYSLGNGADGNVGAETIRYIAFRELTSGVGKIMPRNPMPATGGTAPEPLAEARLFAPASFRAVLERAITADDYATLAADNDRRLAARGLGCAASNSIVTAGISPPQTADPRAALEEEVVEGLGHSGCFASFQPLQGAKGTLRWTGSWYEAQIAVDPYGSEEASAALLDEVDTYLEPYRRIGHDLVVKQAAYVPLDLALSVCVAPQALRGAVETALLEVFSTSVLPGGKLGFFHPDNLGFGDGVYVSRIVAAAQAVAGVTEVAVVRLARLDPCLPAGLRNVPASGVLALAPYEIARLDNDRSLPENGRLTLTLRGGR